MTLQQLWRSDMVTLLCGYFPGNSCKSDFGMKTTNQIYILLLTNLVKICKFCCSSNWKDHPFSYVAITIFKNQEMQIVTLSCIDTLDMKKRLDNDIRGSHRTGTKVNTAYFLQL